MKTALTATRGINVMSKDTQLGKDDVRDAVNVVLKNAGGFARRDGYALSVAGTLESLWSNSTFALVKGGDKLYRITGDTPALTEIASGLWNLPARYTEQGGSIYVSSGRLLRIDAEGNVSTAGVMDLIGVAPTLTTASDGGLEPGAYQVAVAAVNADGEESGLSDAAYVDLDSGGAITVTLPTASADVAGWNVYRTPVNGSELYLAESVLVAASSVTLRYGELKRKETGWLKTPLPAGGDITAYNGYLLSAAGAFLYYTDPYSHLCSARDGFIPMGANCERLLLAVDDGVYVGTDTEIIFLAGGTPNEFTYRVAASNGAVKHSGALVSGDYFDQGLIGGAKQVAVWLSPLGYQLGLPGGKVVSPQSARIALTGPTRAPTTPVDIDGVKQLVSATDAFALVGAVTTP